MLGILLKKQFTELFRNFFYDSRKNKMRSKVQIAAWFVFYFMIMVVFLGGMFAVLSFSICEALLQADLGWLYFLLMGMTAILLGTFGSVFSTYAELYLSKDNDLLLSLPIPVKTIITARLMNVYLMGVMYSGIVILPAILVYWIVAGITFSRVICGILLFLIVTVFVLFLSCLLGWVVAKISVRLKNKSYITVMLSLLFIGGYYYFYARVNGLIQILILNAVMYGEKIKGAAYGLYLFGRIGEGDWTAALIFTVISVILFVVIRNILTHSFLSIAAFGGYTEKVRYVEKQVRVKSPFRALLFKELARFTSSANYMLNCGLGVVFITICGIMLLIRGREFIDLFGQVFSLTQDALAVILCMLICMLTSMNDTAVPSVSLEGKSIWIPQSLPVEPKTVLRAKMSLQLIMTAVPVLFASVCAAMIVDVSVVLKLLIIVFSLVFTVFSAVCGIVLGLRMPSMNWTNEIAVIKRGAAMPIIIFGTWLLVAALAAGYLLFGYKIGAAAYLLLCSVLFAGCSVVLLRWLDTRGSRVFAGL